VVRAAPTVRAAPCRLLSKSPDKRLVPICCGVALLLLVSPAWAQREDPIAVKVAELESRVEGLRVRGGAVLPPAQLAEAAAAVAALKKARRVDLAKLQEAEARVEALEGQLRRHQEAEIERAVAGYEAAGGLVAALGRVGSPASCPAFDEAKARMDGGLKQARDALLRIEADDAQVKAVDGAVAAVEAAVRAGLVALARCGENPLPRNPEGGLVAAAARAAREEMENGHLDSAVLLALAASAGAPAGAPAHREASHVLAAVSSERQEEMAQEVARLRDGCRVAEARLAFLRLEDVIRALSLAAPQRVAEPVARRLPALEETLGEAERRCTAAVVAEPTPLPVKTTPAPRETPSFPPVPPPPAIASPVPTPAPTRIGTAPPIPAAAPSPSPAATPPDIAQAREALAAGRFEEALDRLRPLAATAEARPLLAAALAQRVAARLAKGEVDGARQDAEAAMELDASQREVRRAAAAAWLEAGRAAARAGAGARAVELLGRSVRAWESSVAQRELALALYRQGDVEAAASHLRQALKGGERVDEEIRTAVLVVGSLLAGEQAAALEACDANRPRLAGDQTYRWLAVHALRLSAYRDLAPRVVAAAGRGGPVHGRDGVLVFAGSARDGLPAGVAAALQRPSRAQIALSSDGRFLAVVAGGGVAVFDAQGGRLPRALLSAPSIAPQSPWRALGALDVLEGAAPFLARGPAAVLERGGDRSVLERALGEAVRDLVGPTASYVMVVTTSGAVVTAAGLSGPAPTGNDEASVRAGAATSVISQVASYGGKNYLEVAVPLTVGGARRGALRLGIAAEVERLRSALVASGGAL